MDTPKRANKIGLPRKSLYGLPSRSLYGLPGRNLHEKLERELKGLAINDEPMQQYKQHCQLWSEEEIKALLNYILCRNFTKKWPLMKDEHFWEAAANFISQTIGHEAYKPRTGNACKSKVQRFLMKRFRDPESASKIYFPVCRVSEPSANGVNDLHDDARKTKAATQESTDTAIIQAFLKLETFEQLHTLSCLLQCHLARRNISVPDDFLQLLILSIQHLQKCGRSNIIYQLVKGYGTLRSDGTDSVLPAMRMPTGLIEYCSIFFSTSNMQERVCPDDYKDWLVSMYSLFGTKWVNLFCGPMWSIQSIAQQGTALETVNTSRESYKARVNVPGLSAKTLQRSIASSDFTKNAAIQISLQKEKLLEDAAQNNPHAQWWIKADGCDISKGLGESVLGVWSGDVDLNNGQLPQQYASYQEKLQFVNGFGLGNRASTESIAVDMARLTNDLNADIDFITKELTKRNNEYSGKIEAPRVSKDTMYQLAWEIDELTKLRDRGLVLLRDLELLKTTSNFPRCASKLREDLKFLIKAVSKYKRIAATHIMVYMISAEDRAHKPYALPIQCVPYAGMNESNARLLVKEIIKSMVKHGLNVAGFVSNGEFNYFRIKGYTRPLSIFRIRALVRAKYNKLGLSVLTSMLTPIESKDGTIVAAHANPAVPCDILRKTKNWLNSGIGFDDIIENLRCKTVPEGEKIHMWKEGASNETKADKLRSILAQMEYTYIVFSYHEKGIPFRHYLYVPESIPDDRVDYPFHEREDSAHILKRIATSTREGGPKELRLERYAEALQSNDTGLTWSALTGQRKQSVLDAERLFNPKLQDFMKSKGYTFEENYIRVIGNWRKACDERGISELQRCKYNYEMLNYILEDLMPWYKHLYDFSQLEVNRPINRIRGFTKETLIALTTNIESIEFKRVWNINNKLPIENPRASTTDDVESFFSVLRDAVGKNFTLKVLQNEMRKVYVEYKKRQDPSLPYYYHTSSHDRYFEGDRPQFSAKPLKRTREKRLPRREEPGSLVPGRASLAVHSQQSIRMKFHNQPISLPPPPGLFDLSTEHSYSKTTK